MLFDKSHYGNVISEQLSKYLLDWTDSNDRAKACVETGVGTSTIQYVVRRANTLTESNSKAILALMKIAVENCTNKIAYAKRVKHEFEKQLDYEPTEKNSLLQTTGK